MYEGVSAWVHPFDESGIFMEQRFDYAEHKNR